MPTAKANPYPVKTRFIASYIKRISAITENRISAITENRINAITENRINAINRVATVFRTAGLLRVCIPVLCRPG